MRPRLDIIKIPISWEFEKLRLKCSTIGSNVVTEPQATTVSGMAGWLPYLTPAQRGTIGCNSLPFVCPSARSSHTCRPVRVRVSLNPRPCNTSITLEACVLSDGIRTHTCASLPSTEGKSPMTITATKAKSETTKIPVA